LNRTRRWLAALAKALGGEKEPETLVLLTPAKERK
jgi:hypothetical protein